MPLASNAFTKEPFPLVDLSAQRGVIQGLYLVTPEMATHYLETMHVNRAESKLETGLMAALMEEENFFGEISPVYFDDGHPMRAWDGQHRFQAIIDTGLAEELTFIIGVPDVMAQYIDRGRARTQADSNRMRGVIDYKKKTVLARMLSLYYKFGIEGIRDPNRRVLTPKEQDAFTLHPALPEIIRLADGLWAKTGMTMSHAAYALFLTAERDEHGNIVKVDPDGFWHDVLNGYGPDWGIGNPAFTLHAWLTRASKQGRQPADARLMSLYMITTAWNKHITFNPRLASTHWSKPAPKFEQRFNHRTQKMDKFFPGSSVPDFLPLNARQRLAAAIVPAYAALKGADEEE